MAPQLFHRSEIHLSGGSITVRSCNNVPVAKIGIIGALKEPAKASKFSGLERSPDVG